MQEESKQRRMTMDFSQLHTYTPPQCAPENTGYTYSLSSSYSTAALEFEKEHQIAPVYESPKMSRRSLRLQNSASYYGTESGADYSQNHTSSYTSTRKEGRTSRSRKQQSTSSSMSLSLSQIATPRQTLSFSAASTPIDSSRTTHESDRTSDVSLLASAQDQSQQSLRQRRVTTTTTTTTTTVDGQWGQRSSHSSSNINGDASVSKSHASLPNGYICKDCSFHSQKTDSHITQSSLSSSPCQTAELSTDVLSSVSSPYTSIYTRDRSRRNKTGVLMSMGNSCMHYSKKALAPIASLVSIFYSSLVWLVTKTRSSAGKGVSSDVSAGVQASFSDSWRQAWSSSLSNLWLFRQTALHRMMGSKVYGFEEQGHSSFCGSMNVKDLVTEETSHLNLNGSLCDDCKGKQYTESHTVVLTQTSRSRRFMGALWSLLAYAGSCLLQPGHCVLGAGKALGSGVTSAAQRLLSFFWMIVATPVKAGKGLLWFLATGWYQMVSFMSFLNVFFLTQCLPKLWKLLLLLLLLLLLWWWLPSAAALLAYLPAINLTEWRSRSSFTYFSNLAAVPAAVPATESPMEQAHVTPVSQATPILPPVGVHSTVDLERLERVEQQLALLWDKVQQGDQKQDQRHSDILGLYSSLREQLHSQNERESFEVWVSSLIEQRLGVLRGELEQESKNRAQGLELQKEQHDSQSSRLADLELLLKALATKTEEMQQNQQKYEQKRDEREKVSKSAAVSPPVSVSVKQEDHDALLLEVQRLEAELGKIRGDLQGVAGCKGKCEQLDGLQETISGQVSLQLRKELQSLFFGRGSSAEQQGEIPESLIQWLSQRYVSTPDLQAALASIEHSILKNISLQLEQSQAQTLNQAETRTRSIVQTLTGTVQHTSTAEGLSEEHVKLIVQNALKLYSQDRTGQVDYALESGGGSILSTRCSETYETKTALMSLFGLPLWYFSQSPRVVIQPDVYPGNCWAFKGSQGYLVIRLSLRILPTSFCVEHIPKALSPTGNITSAPRNFTVFGLDDEYQEEGTLLGDYTYEEDGEALQIFPVKEKNEKSFQIIEVRVLSNWGHPEYTCLYRFRVHGEPRPE
ncbi:SUN domain-containing protein 1 isoform X2 [Cyprinodon tularosa]|uniref:SUN domain-containing protein 1 isoform X2 n=2 Tax=Cyprinodon tularosa TaxID=77115 RepID=UPI0018E2154A|nr:SUN domain-containing protein 1 isoform X2 [Cyprinodon tularosa]